VDAEAIVAKLRHRVVPDAGRPNVLVSEDPRYRTEFDASGFDLSLPGEAGRLGISLHTITHGRAPIALAPGKWTAAGNRAVRQVAEGVAERATARDGEIEWDIVIAHPLAGAGPLRVEADVRGAQGPIVRADRSVRWPVGAGRAVQMGELVVRDASGAELHRALPEANGSRLALRVPARVLAEAKYPLTLDPTVSPEIPVSQPTYGPATNYQQAPAVASDGTGFFAVWADDRKIDDTDVFGARIDRWGNVLDESGILISHAAGGEFAPAIAWDGTNFLVVWEDRRSGYVSDIYGSRVSPSGVVLDPTGIPITTNSSSSDLSPAVAWGGNSFLVTWSAAWGGVSSGILGARVSPGGSLLDPTPIPISSGPKSELTPTVAAGAQGFFVAWEDRRADPADASGDIFGTRIASDGTVVDPAGVAISTAAGAQRAPALAWDGTEFLTVWQDDRAGPQSNIVGARVSSQGAVLDPAGITVSAAAGLQGDPTVAWDGTRFLAAWADGRNGSPDIYGTRLSPQGTVLDASGVAISTSPDGEVTPALAHSGTQFFAFWQVFFQSGADDDVRGARVTGALNVLDPTGIAVATAAPYQFSPSLAWNGKTFLVVWGEARLDHSSEIYGARVDADGAVLDGTGIPIASTSSLQFDPKVVWSGTRFLVVWTVFHNGTGYDISGARVTSAGSVLDPGGIAISTASNSQNYADVAWDGSNYFVVWQDERSGSSSKIFGARVTNSGSVLDPNGILVSPAANAQVSPTVAWNGSHHLVVWEEVRSGASDIYATRVTSSGTVVDPNGLPISTAISDQSVPDVAWNGTNFLVVWHARAGSETDIRGARVDAGGTTLDANGISISSAPGDQRDPSTAANGATFLVVWKDERSGTPDVRATRVTGATVNDGQGFVVAGAASRSSQPSVISGAGKFAVAYDRYAPEPPYGNYRAFVRTVSPK
jgi:hypothetical protein